MAVQYRANPRLRDLLDLPVLQVHSRAAAQEADDRHELVAFAATDHGPFTPVSGPVVIRTRAPTGTDGFGRDRQARTEHLVDLPEVALEES